MAADHEHCVWRHLETSGHFRDDGHYVAYGVCNGSNLTRTGCGERVHRVWGPTQQAMREESDLWNRWRLVSEPIDDQWPVT